MNFCILFTERLQILHMFQSRSVKELTLKISILILVFSFIIFDPNFTQNHKANILLFLL